MKNLKFIESEENITLMKSYLTRTYKLIKKIEVEHPQWFNTHLITKSSLASYSLLQLHIHTEFKSTSFKQLSDFYKTISGMVKKHNKLINKAKVILNNNK